MTFYDECQKYFKQIEVIMKDGFKKKTEIAEQMEEFLSSSSNSTTIRVKISNVCLVMDNPNVREFVKSTCSTYCTKDAFGFQTIHETGIKSTDLKPYGEELKVSFFKRLLIH